MSVYAIPPTGCNAIRLEDDQLQQLANLIAERVTEVASHGRPAAPGDAMVSAAELAVTLGVSRRYVYEHADELGGVRVGGGSKPRLRFRLETALEASTRCAGEQSAQRNASGSGVSGARSGSNVRRLPVRVPQTPRMDQILARRRAA